MKPFLKIAASLLVIVLAGYGFVWNQLNQPLTGTLLPANHAFQSARPFTELQLSRPDQGAIHGLLFRRVNSKGCVFFFHGGGGHVGNSIPFIPDHFQRHGYDVFLMDYRQFGKSRGQPSQQHFYDDASAIYYELKKKYGEKQLILVGHSLGCAIAASVAARNHPAKLILVEPFYNLIGKSDGKNPMPWFWPRRTAYTFRTDEFVRQTRCPVYIFSGTKSVLFSAGKNLISLCNSASRLFPIAGAGHDDIFTKTDYDRALASLL